MLSYICSKISIGLDLLKLSFRVWFSVVWTFIVNDTRHHSVRNVVDSRAAAEQVHDILTTVTTRIVVDKSFHDNCKNSPTLIGYFLWAISGRQTHKFVICAMRKRAIYWQFVTAESKLMSVFNTAICPVINNKFRYHLVEYVDPFGYHLVDPKLLWQCYDEIHD